MGVMAAVWGVRKKWTLCCGLQPAAVHGGPGSQQQQVFQLCAALSC